MRAIFPDESLLVLLVQSHPLFSWNTLAERPLPVIVHAPASALFRCELLKIRPGIRTQLSDRVGPHLIQLLIGGIWTSLFLLVIGSEVLCSLRRLSVPLP